MRFEHYSQPILPMKQWLRRVLRSAWVAAMVAGAALAIGIIGYHTLGNMAWVDALLEASMILGGMGPVAPLTSDSVKIFASAYALFSGLVLISMMGILLAPWLHRLLHYLHHDQRKVTRSDPKRRATDR